MRRNMRFTIRFTKREYEMLNNKRMYYGFSNLSEFIRHRLIENSLSVEKMVTDIYSKVCLNEIDKDN